MKARLIMVGPPGAGKGTQAVSLTHTMEIPNISTGAIFRSNMAQGTDLGERHERLWNREISFQMRLLMRWCVLA